MTKQFKDLVVKVLSNSKAPLSAVEIAGKLNAPVQSVNVAMRWLYKDGLVSTDFETRKVRTEYGNYTKPVFGTYKYSLKKRDGP